MKTNTVENVTEASKKYYADHPSGASLHIYLADGNCERDHLEFCLNESRKSNDKEGEKLCVSLLELTDKERARIYQILNGEYPDSDRDPE